MWCKSAVAQKVAKETKKTEWTAADVEPAVTRKAGVAPKALEYADSRGMKVRYVERTRQVRHGAPAASDMKRKRSRAVAWNAYGAAFSHDGLRLASGGNPTPR